ncbi:MAG TPA: type II toxin-antitoxin system VapC family toxin [Chloroflexota bacterium]|jgi:predicted nucleic acid-binding protein|nr:type II toxin-antitoxin system VapC family toxin [Chloroflexota bacterium]
MIVVDTNVVSELMRPSPSAVVVGWMRRNDSQLYTTSITLAEIRYGIERLADGRRKELLRSTAEEVFADFTERVLPFDAEAAVAYATIVSDRDRAGRPIDGFDAQIASICRAHRAALATRNAKDFQDTGIDVIDPWQPDPHAPTDSGP